MRERERDTGTGKAFDLYVRVSISLSVGLNVRPSRLSVCPSVCPFVCQVCQPTLSALSVHLINHSSLLVVPSIIT